MNNKCILYYNIVSIWFNNIISYLLIVLLLMLINVISYSYCPSSDSYNNSSKISLLGSSQ